MLLNCCKESFLAEIVAYIAKKDRFKFQAPVLDVVKEAGGCSSPLNPVLDMPLYYIGEPGQAYRHMYTKSSRLAC